MAKAGAPGALARSMPPSTRSVSPSASSSAVRVPSFITTPTDVCATATDATSIAKAAEIDFKVIYASDFSTKIQIYPQTEADNQEF